MDPIFMAILATSATAFLNPYLAKMSGYTAEPLDEKELEAASQIWSAITTKSKAKR